MNYLTSIALFLSFSTAAVAGDRESDSLRVKGDRGSDSSSAEAGIWPPESDILFPQPATYMDLGSETLNIQLVGSGEGARGTHQYDFDVDGEEYMVEVRNTARNSRLSLYDAEGEIVVGYMTNERGAVIFDDSGVVERGAAGEVDISTMQEYGLTATFLTNPVFLETFLEANGETFEGDDNPPAYWIWPAIVIIGKCAEISISYSSSSGLSGSAGWDC